MKISTIASIWANQIMNNKKTYQEVPRLLKEAVAKILEENGLADLIKE